MLKGLTDRAQGYRVIFMSREPLPDLGGDKHVLSGLSTEASSALLTAEEVNWPEELGEKLVCHLGGNPQLLLMFTAALKRSDVSKDELLMALGGLEDNQAIANFLADQFWVNLSQSHKLVLQAIAMFRQEAPEDILTAMLQERGVKGIRYLLARMTRTGLVLRGEEIDGVNSLYYYGMHEVFKVFCYAQIDLEPRRAWYNLIGSRLKAADPLRAAYHYFKATEYVLTFEVLYEYKEDLLKTGKMEAALGQLNRLTRPMFQENLAYWVEVCELRGEWQQTLGQYEVALKSFGEALGLASELGMDVVYQARLYRGMGVTRYYQGGFKDAGIDDDYEGALFYLYRVDELLEDEQVAEVERGITHYWLARACFVIGSVEESKRYAQLSIKELNSGQGRSWQILAYGTLAAANSRLGDKVACERVLGRAKRLVKEYGLENTVEAAQIYDNMGAFYFDDSRYEKSVEFSLRAFKIGKRIGLVPRVINSGYNLGNAYTQLCRMEKAKYYLDQSLEYSRNIGGAFNEFQALMGLSNIYHRCGDWEGMNCKALSGLELAQREGVVFGQVMALCYLGQYHKDMLMKADWQQGLSYVNQAWDILHDPTAGVDTPVFNAEILSAQAEMKARLGQVDDALEDAEQSLVAAEKMQDDYLKGLAYAALGIVFQFRDQRDEAEANFKKAWEILKEDCYEYGRIQLRMGEMYAHFDEYGQATSHLEKAICRFEEINSRRFLAVAKEKLSSLASPGK
jgi:tetratricopeptide (TPR) repeat protein